MFSDFTKWGFSEKKKKILKTKSIENLKKLSMCFLTGKFI